jgi:hypothetical protein
MLAHVKRHRSRRNEADASSPPAGPIFFDIEDGCEARRERGREGMLAHVKRHRSRRNEADASRSKKNAACPGWEQSGVQHP